MESESEDMGVRARGCDRNYGLEPEDMVSESDSMTGIMGAGGGAKGYTRVMGLSQRIRCQSQRI